MEPTAPQEEIDNLIEAAVPTPPFKFTGWRHWLPYLVGTIFFGAAVAAGYSYYLNGSFPSYPIFKSAAFTPPSGNQIYYALQVSAAIVGTQVSPRQYAVYRSNPDGTGKIQLFLTELGYHDFYLTADKKSIYDLTEKRVSVFDLQKGGTRVVYGLEKQNEKFNRFSFSRDDTLVAREVLTDDKTPGVTSRLEVIDLKTGRAAVAISTQAGSGLAPVFWSSDNKKIYLVTGGSIEATSQLSILNRADSKVTGLEYLLLTGRVSPNGSYFAFTDDSGGKSAWFCDPTGIPANSLSVVNLDQNVQTILEADATRRFSVLGWSPDSTQFIYTKEKSPAQPRCEQKFEATELVRYDVTAKKSSPIASSSALVGIWGTPKITEEVKTAQTSLENTQLVVNGKVLESVLGGQLIKYLGSSE